MFEYKIKIYILTQTYHNFPELNARSYLQILLLTISSFISLVFELKQTEFNHVYNFKKFCHRIFWRQNSIHLNADCFSVA